MTRHDNDRTRAYFTDGARDVTPAAVQDAARVLYVPFADDPEISRHCASVLSDVELQRAARFVAERDRDRFRQRRAFRRFCGAIARGSSAPLSQIHFEDTDSGRPYLADLPGTWFSFSGCRSGFLGAWSSTQAIGVDLEDRTSDVEALQLASRFFTGAEAEVVAGTLGPARLQTFVRFWCLKEAALKSIGEGLAFGLDAFEFALAPGLHVVGAPAEHGGPERFDAHAIDGTGAGAALVIRGRS
jgi:4'-phosphopantetheinyl transferase